MRFLLLSAGNESSIEIIKSLSELNEHSIYGAHWNLVSPIKTYLNKNRIIKVSNPFINEVSFTNQINKAIETLNIDKIFVTNCKLIKFIKDHLMDFKFKERYLLPSYDDLKYCLYKAELYKKLPFVSPKILSEDDLSECFIKPNFGSSSEGAFQAIEYTKVPDGQIKCEYLPGEEVTVDVLCDQNGSLIDFSVRERLQIRDGISSYGKIQPNFDPEIFNIINAVLQEIKLPYVWFLQLKKDKDNHWKLLEVNCRVSGSICITKANGKDYIKELSNLLTNKELTLYKSSSFLEVSRHFNSRPISKKSYIIDLDGTLCSESYGEYHEARPILYNINLVNKLYADNNEIIIYTSRGMKRFNNDVNQVYTNLYSLTEKQLKTWGVKYHKLILGKPAGIYIDNDSLTIKQLGEKICM